jgi:hypothetical protein
MWHVWGKGELHTVLVGKPDGIGPLGRPMRRLDNNVKTNLQEIGWGVGLD